MNKLLLILGLSAAPLVGGCHLDLADVGPSEMAVVTRHAAIKQEKTFEASLRLGLGNLEVAAQRDADLYSLELEYDKSRYEPEVSYTEGENGRLAIRLDNRHTGGLRHKVDGNRLRVSVTNALPLRLDLHNGVGQARLSLSGLRVERLEVESGVGSTKLSSYDPNPIECERIKLRNGVGEMSAVGLGNLNFRELDFEGGVGGADLDLTGEWKRDADVRIQVGVGGVTVRVPRGLGVTVETQKHFLSGLHLDGFVQRDSRYYSKDYDQAKFRVTMRVATGVGGFRITWM